MRLRVLFTWGPVLAGAVALALAVRESERGAPTAAAVAAPHPAPPFRTRPATAAVAPVAEEVAAPAEAGPREADPAAAREAALEAALGRDSDAAIAEFTAALLDDAEWVRDAAQRGLLLHPRPAAVLRALDQLLESEDRATRVAAAELIDEMEATEIPWDLVAAGPVRRRDRAAAAKANSEGDR